MIHNSQFAGRVLRGKWIGLIGANQLECKFPGCLRCTEQSNLSWRLSLYDMEYRACLGEEVLGSATTASPRCQTNDQVESGDSSRTLTKYLLGDQRAESV